MKEKTQKNQFIKASTELQEETASKFGVTIRSVKSALAFDTNSPTAKLIRAYTLNHGAKIYELTEIENPYKDVITLK